MKTICEWSKCNNLGEFKGKKLSTSDIEGLKKLESILIKREKFIEQNKEFSNE